MDEKQYSELMKRLDIINNALLANLIKGVDFKDQVTNLHRTGLTEVEIVRFLKSNRDKVHAIVRNLK